MEYTRLESIVRWLAIFLGIDPDLVFAPFEKDGYEYEDKR